MPSAGLRQCCAQGAELTAGLILLAVHFCHFVLLAQMCFMVVFFFFYPICPSAVLLQNFSCFPFFTWFVVLTRSHDLTLVLAEPRLVCAGVGIDPNPVLVLAVPSAGGGL